MFLSENAMHCFRGNNPLHSLLINSAYFLVSTMGLFELITIASSGVCANVLNDFLKFFIWGGGGGWRHLH